MGQKRTDEFRQDAVRIALTSGLTTARQSIRSIDERGVSRWLMIHCPAGYCEAMHERVGVGMSTLNKWITAHRDTDVVSQEDLDLARENDRLRRENRLLKEEREILKKPPSSLRA